ncbi:uncharacterized protein SPAPADRAFT_147608 [Spathaspora passalidarum NRRL Y-27907]|uniref:Restriction of telomere capping protein 1 n=1 Tax=Spathaspora passalidarum (strain NRRL Y-27907 / 11-Y1) TaxID=619300 RepID=G3AIC2_SPAPN|nr:uncharacterized protein SPAPADRAFT_147608 [Spathaspora passalidarum NRRL Y-27907]EGW33690.1 hypothetical protein SPAPADRAFT_147608 [Spathaspora passalidarum NRRL Y-27907]
MSSSQSNLARFAFNIYGSLTSDNNTPSSPSPTSSFNSIKKVNSGNKLVYHCDRETTALSQLNYPLSISNTEIGSHHAVIGGKNYLHLLCLSSDQHHVVHDINLLDNPYSRVVPKLSSINTIKTHENTIACGLSNGVISIYKLTPSGKSTLSTKLADHKRTINSMDFIHDREDLLLSGSQDGSIKLWDLRSGNKPMLTLQSNNMHSDPIRACQYSPHSSHKLSVLSVHDSGALCKFDLRANTNSYTPDRKWNLHSGPALSLHIHPESEYVATAGRDQKICVFNYSDSNQATGSRATPEHMINTYGPIVKVRWSAYDNNAKNQLYKYDIACSYLNDDSTVTVYNLKRKYIPKHIVNSYSRKAVQNFLWAQNSNRSSTLWCLTKANVFTSYDLDASDGDITRPLEELPKVSMSWNNNFGDLSFVNQYDSDEESIVSEESSEMVEMTRSHTYSGEQEEDIESTDNISRTSLASAPIPSIPFPTSSSLTNSPLDKPPLVRSYTHNPKPTSSSPINTTFTRPRLNRGSSSTTTHDSSISYGSTPFPAPAQPRHKKVQQSTASYISSPYVIPVSLGIPSNDEYVFRTLAMGYVVKIPDGFKLTDVLRMNADVAEDAGVLRVASIWRMLAIAAEELDVTVISPITEETGGDIALSPIPPTMSEKSIASDLNFVGSYNSASTKERVDEKSDGGNESPAELEMLPSSVKPHWHDLDNENLHLMTNVFNSSPTSVGISSNNTYSSMAISASPAASIRPLTASIKPLVPLQLQRNELFLEKKESSTNTLKSGLTMALSEIEQKEDLLPWHLSNLVQQAVGYACTQGDVVFCATVSLLLYDKFPGIISKNECLEWIGSYIDILRRKRMFVQAGNVIKSAPKSIQSTLVQKQQFSTDVNPKFFCCWCNKLLENTSKGYYYCQECKTNQSNCIYCNEPCDGLAVVVSLKCGHRGHFGCLKEWFIEGENIECPTPGCDYTLN